LTGQLNTLKKKGFKKLWLELEEMLLAHAAAEKNIRSAAWAS
jgi:hypothetical protein